MGNCFIDPNEDIVFQGFRNDMENNEMDYEKVCLFGLSGSGKSTLYLNLQQLFNDPEYDHKQQLKHCESIIRSNSLLYIAVLINESEKLYDKTQNDLYYIDYNNKSIKDAIQLITKYIPYNFDKYTPDKPATPIHKTDRSKPIIEPISSITTPHQLPVVEEQKKQFSFESSVEKLAIENLQSNVDSSAFMERFNIDDSQQHKDDNFYKRNKDIIEPTETLKEDQESKHNENIPQNEDKVKVHNVMESDDASYLTMENVESNKLKVKNVNWDIEEFGSGSLMNEYDEFSVDIWNYQFDHLNNNNWKNKFNGTMDADHKHKKYEFEAYKPFDFDAFYVKKREWEKLQNNRNRNNGFGDGRIKYFDEDSELTENGYWTNKKKDSKLLNEELIEDFGAYYEYIQTVTNNANKDEIKQKQWNEFGHKAGIMSSYFAMKLNDKMNPIKHEYEIIGDLWWNPHKQRNDGEFSMKKLEIVLQNKIKVTKLSNYDSDDESGHDQAMELRLTPKQKQLQYKIDIVDGKIKKMTDWDSSVMQKKENLMQQLKKHADDDKDIKISMEENKETEEKQATIATAIEIDEIQEIDSDNKMDELPDEATLVEVNGEKITISQFWNDMKKLGESIKKLWNLPAIKQIYNRHYNLFYFPSNMDYWLYNSTKIFGPHFQATNQHLSLYRNYCTKMQTFKFNDPHAPKVKIFDLPATTPEIRKKYWSREYCINSDAIIFCVSLTDFFHVSFENPTQNAFYLSIQLFYAILHSDWLNRGCTIILFLTHRDRLMQYIRNGHSIKTFAKHFKEWNWRPNGSKSAVINANNERNNNNNNNNISVNITDNDKTLNTIDAMHNTFDVFIQSIEEKEMNKHTMSEVDGNGLFISRNSSLNKERDGTITKFMPELSEDIEIASDDNNIMEPASPSTKNINHNNNTNNQASKENDNMHEVEEEKIDIINIGEKSINFVHELQLKCPLGHELEKLICENSDIYLCDECREDLFAGMVQFECRMDNYDLCGKCHDKLLLTEREKLKKEMEKTDVWVIDEYKGVEYGDRLNTAKSEIERRVEREEKEKEIEIEITPDPKDERKDNKILSQFKKQTRKQNKNKNKNGNDENMKYILSGNKKLRYDGSAFDDERWLMETYDGYCEWIRDQFMKCKDINDRRVIHCHTLNLVNQEDVEKVMYELNNYVFRNMFHNDWLF